MLNNFKKLKKIIYVDMSPNLVVGTEYLRKFFKDSIIDYSDVREKEIFNFQNNDKLEIICIPPWKLNKIHDRMPIILSQNEGENYINDYNSSYLDQEFTSSIEENIDFYSISKYVNNPLNNSIDCIKPLN